MTERVLILGAGHAGGQCAASLRQKGWTGEIVIAGEETHPPYQRPPLSKAYLAGDLSADRLFLKPDAFYEKEKIELRLGACASTIDRAGKKVAFEDGASIDYDYLVLATGARVRRLSCPGADLQGVGYLRSIADVDLLQRHFKTSQNLLIVGAGYIGLEVAAVAAKHGLKVTVIDVADRVMARVASPTVSAFFQKLHHEHGVDLRLQTGLVAFEGEGDTLARAVLDDGSEGGAAIDCDFAVVGIGVLPNDELAAEAGLAVQDGIIVDDQTQTEDPAIFAIGDCTRHPSAYFGETLRLESVHNALEQAKTAAAAICGGGPAYDQVPWFWSDQYDVKLQTVGVTAGRATQEVIRGDIDAKAFSVFYLKGDELIAVDSINAPADHMIARRLIAKGEALDVDALADPEADLKSLM